MTVWLIYHNGNHARSSTGTYRINLAKETCPTVTVSGIGGGRYYIEVSDDGVSLHEGAAADKRLGCQEKQAAL